VHLDFGWLDDFGWMDEWILGKGCETEWNGGKTHFGESLTDFGWRAERVSDKDNKQASKRTLFIENPLPFRSS
jgi:hypothetical protein